MNTEDFELYGEWLETTETRFSGLLAHDQQGRMLLQLRDDDDEIASPGQWAIFGGAIEDGETPLQAMRREAEEEIGIKFAADELEPRARFISKSGKNQFFIFLSNRRIEPHEIRLGEGAGFAFLTMHQVMDCEIAINVRDLLRGHALSFKPNG